MYTPWGSISAPPRLKPCNSGVNTQKKRLKNDIVAIVICSPVKSLSIYYSVQNWTTFNTKYDHCTSVPQ